MDTGNKPEKKFSTGAISATVWKNTGLGKNGETVEFRTISLQRSYKDKDGNWQTSGSLRVNDLPKAVLVLGKAYEHLVLRGPNGDSIDSEDVDFADIS